MKKRTFPKCNFAMLQVAMILAFFFLCFTIKAQVSAKIDTVSIKIGEQINYTIAVAADTLDVVHFPENQTFSPLEMVEALAVDTIEKDQRLLLKRVYALTQFDSGTYVIPAQRIAINEQPFFTDSFSIKVADVVVDTTKQKMYDIKPLIKVERNYAQLTWIILAILLAVMIIGGLIYWFLLRKKPLSEEEKVALLPPFDRAILQLKELENSKYLIEDKFKKYYSELTNIVRSYLEEEVNVSALESTTDQLMEKLELLKDSGQLDLQPETLNQFKKVLHTADLVKFAKSKPSLYVAEEDRKSIESIVITTKESLPEPTEEELLQDESYAEELALKKRKKRMYITAASIALLLVVSVGASLAYFGVKKVKDTVLGYPTKELLEGEWVKSAYGFPPIDLETPEVLLRAEVNLPEEIKDSIDENHVFTYGDFSELFSLTATSTTYKNKETEPNYEMAFGQLLNSFETLGVKNITTKENEFTSKSGVKGIKIFGSGQLKAPDANPRSLKYTIIFFGGKGFMQKVVLSWEDGDEYAENIVKRVLASVDVKASV